MKNRILKKLRSRRGASITFALLLFLVCAVLCSVILAAATASSGRMSKLAETDQRYYAVTSAAELLKDTFKKHASVSIVVAEETTETTTYTNGEAGTPEAGESTTSVYIIADKTAAEITESDYTGACRLKTNGTDNVEFKNDTIQKDAAKNYYNGTALSKRSLSLTTGFHETAGLDYDALAVSILEDLDGNGNLTLTLFNTYQSKNVVSDEGSRYTLRMVLGADQSVSKSTKKKDISSTAVSETSYKVTTQKTTTTTTTLTWNLDGIKTVS